ncbi:MAG: hypothetical protein PHH24_00870 [Candidatus Moranbacteria bacterium]|jgi:hypothetical protein|nr:hypothetical protein [Candidatus Moranbacteria bacterium]MDD5652261.1 hypothetical protein [Candidatus Moranbacteria bacterium]MDX9855809.1 hypothetical protein [Candidatus Moranbacteria bacterium]
MPLKQKILEKEISEILIVNNKKLAPYIESVNFSYQNIDQKKLGTILGIFEIKDTSEDSAYIVNFLASVCKKTYFASHHRTALESFEATLYRLNLSLSEVAKHGNVNWIGKIDAAICSIDDKEINFTVSGDAKILLLREGRLSEISNGLSPKDEAINPIKTFTDIASGKLKDGDKLILTTEDIFHLFSFGDLEKHALSFEKKDFLRFLKTALINELDIAGTIIVDIREKEIEEKIPEIKKAKEDEEKVIAQNINAFSNKTFQKPVSDKKSVPEEVSPPDGTEKEEYTNKKTGHIYVKDSSAENYEEENENLVKKFSFTCKERMSGFCFWLKDRYLEKGSYKIRKSLSSSNLDIKEKAAYFFKETVWGGAAGIFKSVGSLFSGFFISAGNFARRIIPEKPQKIDVELKGSGEDKPEKKSESFLDKIISEKIKISAPDKISFGYEKGPERIFAPKKSGHFSHSMRKIIPSFSKAKRFFIKLSKKQKIYALGLIAAIFIAPIFIIKIQNKKNEIISKVEEVKNHREEMLVNPSSGHYIEAEKIYFGENIIGAIPFEGNIFIITEEKVVLSENGNMKEYYLPDYAREAEAFSFMEDLNLIFLINKDKKISSFSPISKNFSQNNIDIPEDAQIPAIGTYLTYIYLVDSKNSQIYRYPRAEGGFGEKVDWLREGLNLENTASIAIDENIYLIENNNVIRLSGGRKEDFGLKKDENSDIKNIFTNENTDFLYAIDRQNGELIRFRKDGSMESQWSNQEILKSENLWIDEKNGWAYLSTDSEIFRIKMP